MSVFEKRFALILAIFGQSGDRVKGGVLCRLCEPLTRSPACRINPDQGEALGRCCVCVGETSRATIAEGAMGPNSVVLPTPASETAQHPLRGRVDGNRSAPARPDSRMTRE